MRSLWLDRGTGPNAAKIAQYAIECVYEDGRDATKASVTANMQSVGAAGVYYVVGKGAGWPVVPLTARAAADWVNEQLKRCDLGKPDQPRVHLNYEGDDPAWIDEFLRRFRAHRPTRIALWTMQAHKANVYADQPVISTLVALRIGIGPQCYVGSPEVRVESASEVQAWAANGVPVAQIDPFLWAADLGGWWQGTAFIAGRLP